MRSSSLGNKGQTVINKNRTAFRLSGRLCALGQRLSDTEEGGKVNTPTKVADGKTTRVRDSDGK
eukprot:4552364-Amphidinium_carterae.1